MGKLKVLSDFDIPPKVKMEMIDTAFDYIKRQTIPQDGQNRMGLFFHCMKCGAGKLEVGYSAVSQSVILVQCPVCHHVVASFNMADTQNDWIRHFFTINEGAYPEPKGCDQCQGHAK